MDSVDPVDDRGDGHQHRDRTAASPFDAACAQPWSLPAIGMASIAMTFLEPDPVAEWNDERLAAIHRTLDAWETPDS